MVKENEDVIGIDLGANASSVAVWTNGRPEPLPPVPSTVAFAGTSVLFGEAADSQIRTNPKNTIPSVLTFLGQRLEEARQIVETVAEHSMIAIAQSTRTNQNARPVIVIGEPDGDPDDTNVRAALSFAPEEVAALFLRHLKELAENRLGSRVSKAVIAVPSGFNNAQRSAVRNAGAIAGLDVLRLINAPTAAAVACNLSSSGNFVVGGLTGSEPHNTNATTDEERNIAVVDFGGGHFEVSVINIDEEVFDVKATALHKSLSGAAVDRALAQHFAQQFQRSQPSRTDVSSNDLQRRLMRACRRAKENLTDSLETRLPKVEFCGTCREMPDDDGHGAPELFWEQQTLTRSSFMEICGGLLDEIVPTIKMALCGAKLDKRAVDQVLLVGGCTLIPTVRNIVADFFSGVPIVTGTSCLGDGVATSHRSKQALACGAAIQGSLLLTNTATDDNTSSLDLKDVLILEGTARSIGIETAGGVMSSVFKRNTTVPVTSTQTFTTYCDSAQAPQLRVFEGERLLSKDNTLTGSYSLRGVPPAPRQVPRIHVTFHLDADGILTVSAVDKTDGDRERDIAVTSDTSALSAAEVQRMAQRNSV